MGSDTVPLKFSRKSAELESDGGGCNERGKRIFLDGVGRKIADHKVPSAMPWHPPA